MKGKRLLGLTLALAVLAGSLGGVAIPITAAETSTDTIPLIAWYNTPASSWEAQATPLGNGFIGGMVFGGVESDRIQINEHTLWSGGPGANANYDGGASGNKEEIHNALQQVREKLQEEMTNFTNNSSATLVNGQVQAHNISNSAEIGQLLQKLKGEKDNFGSYQTLGDLNLIDSTGEVAAFVGATSNAEPLSGDEGSIKLFDGNVGSKWFAGNGEQGGGMPAPYIVEWSYTAAKSMGGYTISSANDMEGRDPQSWELYGSNNGVDYVLIDTRTDETFSGRQVTNTYEIAQAVKYSHYRLTVTKTREDLPVQMSEIELCAAKPAFVDATSNAEPNNPDEASAKLFDGSVGSKWFAGNGPQGGGMQAPYIVEWSYTAPKFINGYTISSANDMPGRDP